MDTVTLEPEQTRGRIPALEMLDMDSMRRCEKPAGKWAALKRHAYTERWKRVRASFRGHPGTGPVLAASYEVRGKSHDSRHLPEEMNRRTAACMPYTVVIAVVTPTQSAFT